MENKLVTIIMATLNRAHFIEESLLSIQSQSYTNWECLIIDDGSKDNTLEVISRFLNEDKRFRYFNRPENYIKGLSGSRNFGLDISKGDFIIFFDDDDYVHPDNLKTCLETFNQYDVDFCHYQKKPFLDKKPTINYFKTEVNKNLSIDNIEEVISNKIGLASCTVMWKKKCFESNRFNQLLLYAEEWECYTRIISQGFQGIIINNVLYYNRKHLNSNTGEFYNFNSVRRKSNVEAILLVVENLKNRKLVTQNLKKQFIITSINFKEYNLKNKVLDLLDLNIFEKIKLNFIYYYFKSRFHISSKIKRKHIQ